jgi:hypothetical protein
MLTNPAVVSVLAFTALLACRLARLGLRQSEQYLGIAGAGAALTISPWILRNHTTFGQPVFRTNLGMTLYSSVGDCSAPGFAGNRTCYDGRHPSASAAELQRFREMGEVEYDRRRTADAFAWMRANPAATAKLMLGRARLFWFPEITIGLGYQAWAVAAVTVLSLAGLFLLLMQRSAAAWFFACVWLIFPLVYYLVVADFRYRLPILWTSLLPAGYFLDQVWSKAISRCAR